jgi:hypothetical protein
MQKTQLLVMKSLLETVGAVVDGQTALQERFDTYTRLVNILSEKQALNGCDSIHWSWVRDLKDDLAHYRRSWEIKEKAYVERRAREAKLQAENDLRNLPHKTIDRPKKEKGKGKQPHRIKFMGEYTSETEDYYSFFARRFATRRPHHRRAHARESPHKHRRSNYTRNAVSSISFSQSTVATNSSASCSFSSSFSQSSAEKPHSL